MDNLLRYVCLRKKKKTVFVTKIPITANNTPCFFEFLESSSRPCHATSCLNEGACEEDLTEWSFKCKCNERFLGDRCEDGE